jgi:hypothetical protein
MDNILATAGRLVTSPRQPRLVRLDRRTAYSGFIISLFGLLLQAQAATSVSLAWDPSRASGIAGYRLHYGTSNGSYSQQIDVGNTTTATVSNLVDGQRYYFIITGYDASGVESEPSNQLSFTVTPSGPFAVSPQPGLADFNGDSQADLVWENTTTGQRAIWFMMNGSLLSTTILQTISPQWHIVGAADFNGDGQADLVWENTVTGQRAIWFMKNGVLSSTITLPTISTEWHIAGAADFNGDGLADLVLENTVTGQRCIWFLNNGMFQSGMSLPTVSTDWHIAGAGDFNGDGQSDLVLENSVTGQRVIWFMKNGVIQTATNLPTLSTDWHIADH